ncbi:MAG: hypothetical protein KDC87_17260 [Planctomycetes bacterium]|nr:hypothetical protein [Planctomycetota bacterium]MCB9872233.1 hypothetical protein [Planctomycetota bacterium]MCB9888059.1 hypothetical protein [Planctomycetota bacterium]
MFDPGTETAFAHRVLDAIDARAKVAMHNLANKNTPGFKRFVVEFEGELRAAIRQGRDPGEVLPRIRRDKSGSPGVNNVSEYDEISLMEKARALHEIFTRRIGGYFNNLNRAIRGQ